MKRNIARFLTYTMVVLLGVMVVEVTGKGAKVRPKKIKNNRDQDRYRGRGDASNGGSADRLNYLAAYMFRNASHEERLLAYLFQDYDPVARAVMDTDKPVVVTVDFVLLRIHGLDERGQVLTTTGLVIAEWVDERLVWDPDKFGNLTSIIVKAEKLWLPELAVMNGAEELMPDFDRIRVLLNSNGLLHWEPGGIFRTTCDIDITYFPFDVQHCPMLIGAYSYYSNKMNITNGSDIMITHDFRLNGEWHVSGTSAAWNITVLNPCCEHNGYAHVVFTLHLKRRSKFYVMNIVLPCVMLSVLIMIGFFLPPDAGEKISLGISVLLAFTVFLLMIADNIPRTSLAIPLIVIYLTATMTLGTISICMTVLVLNVHHRGPAQPVPPLVRKFVFGCLGRIFCVTTQYSTAMKKENFALKRNRKADFLHQQYRLRTAATNVSKNGALDLDDFELIGLTVNSPKTSIPLTHAHIPNTSLNGPPRVAIPATPPSVQTERKRFHRRKTVTEEPEPLPPDYSEEWHDLAHVMDRIFFWVLFICMTASAVFTLLYPQYMGANAQ